MFQKFAKAEIIGVKGAPERLGRTASLDHFADYEDFRTDDGFIYVRVRAISSRVNKNHDGWPSEELGKAYKTFVGKPIFVDHHNHDPKRARGVIVDAKLHIEDPKKTSALDSYYASAPQEHLPPTWIELLLETDAKAFPKLAKAIIDGDIDGVSMGCNVERSKCSHCGNWARVPEEYCSHIRNKGAEYDFFRKGVKESKKSYEDCYDIGFFEISYVFDPADETALVREIRSSLDQPTEHTASKRQSAYFDDPHDYANYLHDTLIPDLHDSGSSETAQDFETIHNHIRNGTNDPQYEQWLQSTLIPDLRESGRDYTAADLEEGIHHMRGGQPGGNGEHAMQQGAPYNQIESWDRGQQPSREASDRDEQGNIKCPNCGNPNTSERKTCGVCDAKLPQPGTNSRDSASSEEKRKHPPHKNHGGCPTCGSHSIAWGTGVTGLCQNCGAHVEAELADDPDEGEADGGSPITSKTADTRRMPQSELMSAPAEVDTLRQEVPCPVCGTQMEDGNCDVCGFQEEPEGFGNPDLQVAQETNNDQQQADMAAGQPGQPVPEAAAPAPGPAPGMGAPAPGAPLQAAASANVSSDNTGKTPVLPVPQTQSDQPKSQKRIQDATKPTESSFREETMSDDNKRTAEVVPGDPTATGTAVSVEDVGGVGGADENPEGHKNVDVDGVGAVDSDENPPRHKTVDVEAPIKGELGDPTKTWGDGGRQHSPVGGEAPVLGGAKKSLQILPAPKPDATVSVDAPVRGEIGDNTKTWGGDDFHLTDPVTNEAFPSEGGVEHVEKGTPDNSAFPSEGGVEPRGKGTPDSKGASVAKRQWTTALRVARTEIALGIRTSETEFERLAELENEPVEQLEAILAAYASVKTAGLKKSGSTQKTASVGNLPSLAQAHPHVSRQVESKDETVQLAESIFG